MTTSTQDLATNLLETPDTDWTLGWRYETVNGSDGKLETIRVLQTAQERLHPEEGYIMPERTEHDRISDDLCDMFRTFYDAPPEMAVYRNLVFKWDVPGMKDFAPDVAIVPNVKERERNRRSFDVAAEGTRPCLVIEVVSPSSRTDDRITKVRDYARLGIDEYIYYRLSALPKRGHWGSGRLSFDRGSILAHVTR